MTNPFPPGHIFSHFVRTDTPENIYYADLFRIGGKHWMIQGYCKTHAARIASNDSKEDMIATDAVALIRDCDILYGRYDLGVLSSKNSDLYALHKLDAIVYCLDEEQTANAFATRGGKCEIVDVGNDVLSALCATYPYPASMARYFFSEHELAHFSNPLRMTEQFRALTQGISDTKFLLVPFMPTVEDKAALYLNYVL